MYRDAIANTLSDKTLHDLEAFDQISPRRLDLMADHLKYQHEEMAAAYGASFNGGELHPRKCLQLVDWLRHSTG